MNGDTDDPAARTGADDTDDARLAKKRVRDAASARKRRADARRAREDAWEATIQASARAAATSENVVDDAQATAPMGGIVDDDASQRVVYLPVRHSSLLDEHIRRAARYLALVEADRTVSIIEKARLFVGAIPALAKGVEAVELRGRLEAIEARLDARDRRGRW